MTYYNLASTLPRSNNTTTHGLFCVIDGNKNEGGKADIVTCNGESALNSAISQPEGIFGQDVSDYPSVNQKKYTYTFPEPVNCSYLFDSSAVELAFTLYTLGQSDISNHSCNVNTKVYFDNSDYFWEENVLLGEGTVGETHQTIHADGRVYNQRISSIEVTVSSQDSNYTSWGIEKVELRTQIATGNVIYINTETPLKCVTGSNETYSLKNALPAINTSSLADGDYYLIVTKTGNSYAIPYDNVCKQTSEPTSEQRDNCIWLNTSSVPIALKYNNVANTWERTSDVPVGIASVRNGLITYLKSLPFNNLYANGMASDFAPLQLAEQWLSSNDGWGYKLYANNYYEMYGRCWVNAQWIGGGTGYIGLWKPLFRGSIQCVCSVENPSGGDFMCVPELSTAGGTADMCTGVRVNLKGNASVTESWFPVDFIIRGYLYFKER